MSIGPSGRIVVEIDPEFKRRFYAELARAGMTFKDWLIVHAEQYVRDRHQFTLFAHERAPEDPEPRREG